MAGADQERQSPLRNHAPALELPAAIGAAIETFQGMTAWFDVELAST